MFGLKFQEFFFSLVDFFFFNIFSLYFSLLKDIL